MKLITRANTRTLGYGRWVFTDRDRIGSIKSSWSGRLRFNSFWASYSHSVSGNKFVSHPNWR